MDFPSLFHETLQAENYFGTEPTKDVESYKDNPLASLALNIVKRDTEKVALLRLKGFERVDIERSRGKHSVVCRHWLKGMCMKGEFCDFLHQLVYSRMPPCKTIEKNSFCTDRLKGCCIFKHDDDDDTADFGTSKEFQSEEEYEDLSYLTDVDRFTKAFNAAILYAFPSIVKYS